MTEQDKTLLICEFLGYHVKYSQHGARKMTTLLAPKDWIKVALIQFEGTKTLKDFIFLLPRFNEDLNAIHQAVMSLDDNDRDLYNIELEEMLCSFGPWSELNDLDVTINATAQERTDALVSLIKKKQKNLKRIQKEKDTKKELARLRKLQKANK